MNKTKLSAAISLSLILVACSSDSDNEDASVPDTGVSISAPQIASVTPIQNGVLVDWESLANADSFNIYIASERFDTMDEFMRLPNTKAFADVKAPFQVRYESDDSIYVGVVVLSGGGRSEVNVVNIPISMLDHDFAPTYIKDTGVDWCTSGPQFVDCSDPRALPLQDAKQKTSIEFGYQKLNAKGEVIDWEADQWCAIQDIQTGRTWLAQTEDGSMLDHENTFSFFDSSFEALVGDSGLFDAGVCSDGRCDTEYLVQHANEQRYCGMVGWRLPRTSELYSIVDYKAIKEERQPEAFPLLKGIWYWTSDAQYEPRSSSLMVYQVMPQAARTFVARANFGPLPNSRAHAMLVTSFDGGQE